MASTMNKRTKKHIPKYPKLAMDHLQMSVTSDLDIRSPTSPSAPSLPSPSPSPSSLQSPKYEESQTKSISIKNSIRPLNMIHINQSIPEIDSRSAPESPALPSLRSINKHKTKLTKQRVRKQRISQRQNKKKRRKKQRKKKRYNNNDSPSSSSSSSSCSSDSDSDNDHRFKQFERTRRSKKKQKRKKKGHHTPRSPSAPFIGVNFSDLCNNMNNTKTNGKYHKKGTSDNTKIRHYNNRTSSIRTASVDRNRMNIPHSFDHNNYNQNNHDNDKNKKQYKQRNNNSLKLTNYHSSYQIQSIPKLTNISSTSYWSNVISSDDTFFSELQSIVTISNDIDLHEYRYGAECKQNINNKNNNNIQIEHAKCFLNNGNFVWNVKSNNGFNQEKQRKTHLDKLEKQRFEEEERQKHETILLDILKSTSSTEIINCILTAKTNVLCYFLPIIAFALNTESNKSWKNELISALQQRINNDKDIKQSVIFLLTSYNDIKCMKDLFSGNDILNKSNRKIVNFWEKLIKMKLKTGAVIDVHDIINNKDVILHDPVKCVSGKLSKILVKKVINSNAKPLLLDIYCNAFDPEKNNNNKNNQYQYRKTVFSSRLILKYGDDLRKDAAIMMMFRFMNYWWLKCNLFYDNKPIKITTYGVVPINAKLGVIELIPNCIPLKQISSFAKNNNLQRKDYINLIVSAVGSYIGSYVMGIRDRHYDNILINTHDCTLFHIDFNYLLGEKINGVDTAQFAITKKLYNVLGKEYYAIFVDLATKAFQVLRGYHYGLINFAQLVFNQLTDKDIIEKYLFKKLKLNINDTNAKKWLIKKLNNAPFNKQTKLKNKIHKIATGGHT